MDRALEELVWRRARFQCEYCQMPQEHDDFGHQIDHVVARKHGGPTAPGNLALACFPCNNYKGPNLAGIDPVTRKLTKLFNPRRHKWERHFRWGGPYLVGKTAIGRTTIRVLEINDQARVDLRQVLLEGGDFPR